MTQREIDIISVALPIIQACPTYRGVDVLSMIDRMTLDRVKAHALALFDALTDGEQHGVIRVAEEYLAERPEHIFC